jgi:two-component system cell cycle sensor histidine kinase/response regulator CckA
MEGQQGVGKNYHFEKNKEEREEQKGHPPNSKIDYRALMEQIPAVTYITALDETGGRLYISPQIETMLGFPSSEWLTDPQLWFRQIYPDDRKRVLTEFYKSHSNGQSFRSEYRLIARDGHIVWVRDEGTVVRDESGHPCFIRGFMFDISELLRAKEAIQKSEARFRAIFNGMAVGIALVNTDGRVMESNQALQKMLGYRGEELYNRILNELAHPEDATQDLDLHKKLITGEKDHYQIEKRYIRKDGEVVWGRLNVSLTYGLGRVPPYTIHMVEDITEWKQLEMQFLQSQKLETVGQLAGGIAHDLNNLFTILSGYSQLSLLEINEDHPLRGNLEEIRRTTERAAQLTHQFLAISRRQVLDMKVLNLNQLLKGLERMLGRIIGEDIELITRLAEDLGRVKTDPGQIEQAILNLVVNARDAMPNGGRLIIETENVELDKSYARSHFNVTPGRYVRISVTDTGCGMSPEVEEKIFDPFFTTKGKGKGTGLGLSTVYGIVKQSGGYVWVYSEQNQGTAFKIYLPRVDEEADDLSSRSDSGHLPKGMETILLVEDDPNVRGLAALVLRQQGYTVLEATNGNEGIELARGQMEEKIHLLITDLVMPQMGGKELVEQFKLLHPDTRILFISGYTDGIIIHQASLKSGTPFLQKPFSPTDLAKKVRDVLDQ